ncbi:sensor histidine kinase [Nonomuraea angiospora]|uniref:Two-component system sensor histidine kinase DesK n=1 Tax=Nonomuraea angiospora TaxID=46172 RepID=A0ABR9MFL8_9ACTN|nr:histidine kinase [Nonomuraea angiospora]MBE1591697.1 two-component system sensor histidine kinase DesK [Nonomuraea angiospora]
MGASQRLRGVGPGTVRLARATAGVFLVGMAAFVAVPLAEALGAYSSVRVVTAVVLVIGLTGCYLWLAVRAVLDRGSRWDLAVLAVMCVLALAVPFAAGPTWLSVGFMLPLAFAVTLRGRWAALGFFASLAAGLVLPASQDLSWVLFGSLQNLLTAGALAGLTIFATLLAELQRTREEAAKLAITEERLRFARELHDVLGHNLSVIAMRTELGIRVPPEEIGRLRRELTEIHDIASRSLHDVRAVVKGYREMSLERELSGVRRVLETAGVRCDFAELPPSLPPEVRVALAWAVREAATNLLRHSDATVCLLGVETEGDRITVTVANDGVRPDSDSITAGAAAGAGADAEVTVGGSGLAGLDERLAQVGGSCGRHTEDGWFTLSLDVPGRPLAATLTSATGDRR